MHPEAKKGSSVDNIKPLWSKFNDAKTLSITTLSIMTLSITTFSITTLIIINSL